MILPTLLPLLVFAATSEPTRAGSSALELLQEDPAKEFTNRFEQAGEDVAKLWDLYLWADAYGLKNETRRCLRKIVQVDPQHRPANEALGYVFYAGRWFPSERKLEEFKKEEEVRLATEKGLVRWKDEWVPAEDLPQLEKGLVRDDQGRWVNKEEFEKLQAGWRRQDLLWISPEEAAKLDQGLWKCGTDWLPIEGADRYHSQLGRWWSIPTDAFVLHTTCNRQLAERATHVLYATVRDLVRVLGTQPAEPGTVLLLNSTQQYNEVASNESPVGAVASHGLSSAHNAFFADVWFDSTTGAFHGAGIGYWDASNERDDKYGPHSLRHAAAQSFLEGLDPSPKAIQRTQRNRGQAPDLKAFYAEKRFPEWFRYGAASYAERYFIDTTVATDGNSKWAREWSIQNIVGGGGLRPISQILSKELDPSDPADASKLMNERGLLVAFMVDGGFPPLAEAHGELKMKIRKGEDLKSVFAKIQKLLVDNEQQLRKFANL